MTGSALRTAEVSLDAIRHNVQFIKNRTGGNVIIVVKANAYGHGAVPVGRAALEAGATMLGVADLSEAYALRDGGITAPVLCWIHGPSSDFDEVVARDITLAIGFESQLERLAAAAGKAGKVAELHLKLDTGLSRNGASSEDWPSLFARAKQLENEGLVKVRGMFTHISNTNDDEDRLQQEQFERAIVALREAGIEPEYLHMASSAATLTSPHLYYNTVRVGLLTYGLSPFDDQTSAEIGLRPAMTLRAQVAAIRDVEAGAGVSYSYIYRVPSATRLALVPVGYADGLRRALSGAGASAVIRGKRCPIVGRISMDQFLMNLEPLGDEAAEIDLGEPVTLFGDPEQGAPSIDEWAAFADTINYEIATGIGVRVAREWVEAE
ncbi:alanine racemase [Leucobacter chinensis]|uniref:alanine racemase n=1 Tax=Leucobacter chinensis TaxID=2851010 RepID=UPI001C2314D1|nr:alanine racemase [Leucobacter chinensis]